MEELRTLKRNEPEHYTKKERQEMRAKGMAEMLKARRCVWGYPRRDLHVHDVRWWQCLCVLPASGSRVHCEMWKVLRNERSYVSVFQPETGVCVYDTIEWPKVVLTTSRVQLVARGDSPSSFPLFLRQLPLHNLWVLSGFFQAA